MADGRDRDGAQMVNEAFAELEAELLREVVRCFGGG